MPSDAKHSLKLSLQALAQPADFQLLLLDSWAEPPAELPERVVQAWRALLARNTDVTPEQRSAMSALFDKIEAFSGPSNNEHWSEYGLRESEHWNHVRSRARTCLDAFHWPLEAPPLDIKDYGEDFSSP
ncbi:MAG TPA: hypothetical protein VI072_36440 [Polyangiaceae bacterium]